MYEFSMPEHARFNLKTSFENLDLNAQQRIGVVTDIYLDFDFLNIMGGVGDSGLHDNLARQTRPTGTKIIQLPTEMYSKKGTITWWYDQSPVCEKHNNLGIVASQIETAGYNENPEMGYNQTDRCLRMAALALGIILMKTPRDLTKLTNQDNLVFGSKILAKAENSFGYRIFN